MEIRRSYDRLISTIGFPILIRWHLYIESGPRFLDWCYILLWKKTFQTVMSKLHSTEVLFNSAKGLMRIKNVVFLWQDRMAPINWSSKNMVRGTSSQQTISCHATESNLSIHSGLNNMVGILQVTFSNATFVFDSNFNLCPGIELTGI